MVNFTFILSLVYSVDFLLLLVLCTVSFIGVVLPGVFFLLKLQINRQKTIQCQKSSKLRVGFFHPYCNAGGGGEKVLWIAISALLEQYPDIEVYVYTGDVEVTPTEILTKVAQNLNVHVVDVKFVYLNRRKWIESEQYPYFTLLGQALGSIYLGLEAIFQLVPDVFIETTGLSFTLPVFRYLGGVRCGCYVHYPIISRAMLKRVHQRREIYNNRPIIVRNPFFTHAKLLYYQLFMWMYSLAGQCSDTSLVNSTFTLDHLNGLWKRPLHLVYPPCDVDSFKQLSPPRLKSSSPVRILSVAQFRPEKDHPLQLQTLYELREIVPDDLFARITLVLCGGCRNADDSRRVRDLKDLSKHLSLENNVEFHVNLTHTELMDQFGSAMFGIHTMLDEHFGIGVVELMAAGLLTVAHKSGGPLLDIIETSDGSRLGFLANTADQYARILKFLLTECSDDELDVIRERARASVDRFSRQRFKTEFLRAIAPLFK